MKNSGFTLVEIMITVAIVGILAAVAMPQYSDYVTRGKIPDATSALASRALALEQYFQDNRTYVAAPACDADTATSRHFDFGCTGVSATGYTLSATGKSSMAGFTYAITQAGARSTTAVPTGWTLPSPNNCWVSKKGGVC